MGGAEGQQNVLDRPFQNRMGEGYPVQLRAVYLPRVVCLRDHCRLVFHHVLAIGPGKTRRQVSLSAQLAFCFRPLSRRQKSYGSDGGF